MFIKFSSSSSSSSFSSFYYLVVVSLFNSRLMWMVKPLASSPPSPRISRLELVICEYVCICICIYLSIYLFMQDG